MLLTTTFAITAITTSVEYHPSHPIPMFSRTMANTLIVVTS